VSDGVNLPATAPVKREIQTVVDPVPILDTARFEHMQRIANVMARSTMIPETLRTFGTKDNKQDLPFEQILSNCFLVVNQAARWGMDPFSVISCCSVVHGRLAYEGKLVSAVLDAKLGIRLHHHFTGNPAGDDYRIYLSDQPFTPEIIAELKPSFSKPGWRIFDGSVGEWKTTGTGTPWTAKNYRRMLIYRGTRDWTRIYESALMLGVYTDDEMLDLMEDARARRATPVASLSLADRLAAAKAPALGASGFDHDHVTRETESQAKEPEASGGTAQCASPEVRVGEASADLPATSEHMDVTAGETAPDSHSAVPPSQAQPDTPADDAPPTPESSAGNLSEDSPVSRASGEGGGDDAVGETGDTSSPPLPEGWAIQYAAALRRAQKKESLAKYAKEFWDQHGGWDAHKMSADGLTAIAIFDAFSQNFGNKGAIENLLREIV
jgi:hypothetical protein